MTAKVVSKLSSVSERAHGAGSGLCKWLERFRNGVCLKVGGYEADLLRWRQMVSLAVNL